MSHLAHALDVKRQLTEAGILCPEEQSHLLSEAYIRAGLACVYKVGGTFNEDQEKVLWKQLEKWNCVSPINGRFIHTSIMTRMNLINGSLATTGGLPCPLKFSTYANLDENTVVNVADMEAFPVLVAFLIKELESAHE